MSSPDAQQPPVETEDPATKAGSETSSDDEQVTTNSTPSETKLGDDADTGAKLTIEERAAKLQALRAKMVSPFIVYSQTAHPS